MMEATLEHTIAALVFAVIGGLFLVAGVILHVLNNQALKLAGGMKTENNPSKIVQLLIVITVIVIAVLVVPSQILK